MSKILTRRGKIVFWVIFFVIVCFSAYIIYRNITAQPVTYESQRQAETPAGVELAAKNAHINMLQSQLEQAAQQIAMLKNKPPDTVYHPVPYEVPKIIEVERQNRGADFAVVTDPKLPDKAVNIKEIVKLPADTPVTLNQYNVFAYKKIIRGVNVYPKCKGLTPIGVNEITADVSRKITNDGKYLGVVVGYDFEGRKAKVGLRVTF